MSDKQRMAHNAERYWNGPLTRAEAQKVFDETAGVIQSQQQTIAKLDMVLAFLVEKGGYQTAEIQTWMNAKVLDMQKKQAETQLSQVGMNKDTVAPLTPQPTDGQGSFSDEQAEHQGSVVLA
jgi:hypothetical protein